MVYYVKILNSNHKTISTMNFRPNDPSFLHDELPDIARSDAGIIYISEWKMDTPMQQQAAADVNMVAWEKTQWPEGLLSHSCFISSSDNTLLHYSQWTGEEAYIRFFQTSRDSRVASIDELVPGIERVAIEKYSLHHSIYTDPEQKASCIVVVDLEFENPALSTQWIKAISDALASKPEPPAGLIAAHFHISTDGKRVINYAEWKDEASHNEATGAGNGMDISKDTSAEWHRVLHFPGMHSKGFKRYPAFRSISRPLVLNQG